MEVSYRKEKVICNENSSLSNGWMPNSLVNMMSTSEIDETEAKFVAYEQNVIVYKFLTLSFVLRQWRC